MKTVLTIFLLLSVLYSSAQEVTVVAPKQFVCSLQLGISADDTLEFPNFEPSFPGGKEAMEKYLKDNIQFPEEALENGEQGNVYVQFTVEIDGSLSNVTIVKGVSQALDRETKRLIRNMPKWLPAEEKGKKITSVIRIPVEFRLD